MKDRLATIELSGIRAFSDYCNQFEDVVFLTIGEPDFDTPEVLKEALIESVKRNETHYPPAIGIPSFRQKIADYESGAYGETLTKDNVIVTIGATEGLAMSLWATCEAGDEVIVPTPCFALYFSQIALGGAKAVPLYNADDDFQITETRFNACLSEKTKAILFASPNNPTGTVLNEASLEVIYNHALKHKDFMILMDDVYQSFVYEGSCPSLRKFASLRDQLIVIQSFSKSHAMTGWRLGYVLARPDLISEMHKLHQNLVTGVPFFVQKAAEKAFELDLKYMTDDYRERRDYVVARLNKMGLRVTAPQGAFYIFVDVRKYNPDSLSFAKHILEKVGVAVIPGVYFGQDGFVRISYCYSVDLLEKAMDRLEYFMVHEI